MDEESTIAGAYERGFDWWKHARGTSFAILRGEAFSPKCRTIADSRIGQRFDWSLTGANQKASMPRSISNPVPSRVKAKKRDRNRTSGRSKSTWHGPTGTKQAPHHRLLRLHECDWPESFWSTFWSSRNSVCEQRKSFLERVHRLHFDSYHREEYT